MPIYSGFLLFGLKFIIFWLIKTENSDIIYPANRRFAGYRLVAIKLNLTVICLRG